MMSIVRPTAGFEQCCFNSTYPLHSTQSKLAQCFLVDSTCLLYQAQRSIGVCIVPDRQKTVGSWWSIVVVLHRLRVRCSTRIRTRPTAVRNVYVTRCYCFLRDRPRLTCDDAQLYVALNDSQTVCPITRTRQMRSSSVPEHDNELKSRLQQ